MDTSRFSTLQPKASVAVAEILGEPRPFPLPDPAAESPSSHREFDSYFTHGFILSSGTIGRPEIGSWSDLAIGAFRGYAESQTRVGRATGSTDADVILLGDPVDLSLGEIDSSRIAAAVVKTIPHSGRLEAAVDYVSRLGGRFICLIWIPEQLIVVPDCHATQATYLYSADGAASLASHASLLAELWQLPPNPEAKRVLDARKSLNPRGTVHLPGLVTPYAGVSPLIANCLARLGVDGKISHERFYPVREIKQSASFEAAYDEFEGIFLEHLRLLGRLGVIGVALTSGYDSRATLSVAQHLSPYGLFAYTFFGFNRQNEEEILDITGANNTAFANRVPHLIVRWDLDARDGRFAEMYAKTWPTLGQAKGIARAYYEGLPSGFVGLMSTGAETGSVFYKNRTNDLTVPKVMGGTYVGRPDEDGILQQVFEDYQEWTGFPRAGGFGIDLYDLFYWEHRNSRWLATRYQEMDLSHRVIVPFNQRGIIEAMLKAPREVREANAFQKRLIERFGTDGG